MNALAALQALAALFGQIVPLFDEVVEAIKSDDQASLDATLARLQAFNDALMRP